MRETWTWLDQVKHRSFQKKKKLNTDGSVTGNPRLAGDGGLLIKEF